MKALFDTNVLLAAFLTEGVSQSFSRAYASQSLNGRKVDLTFRDPDNWHAKYGSKAEEYAQNPKGAFDVKLLKGKYAVFKRLRVGNYRVIFDDEGNVMLIYEVKHRQEAYHD